MNAHRAAVGRYTLEDGLGVRWIEQSASLSSGEVLEVAPALAVHPAAEQELRTRAARYAPLEGIAVARVRRIDRDGDALRVTADMPDGVRLSDLLADLEFGNETLGDDGVLALATLVIRAVTAVHQLPGGFAHGALNPAHVVLTRDGAAVLTDGIFASALEALQRNRAQLWREFGLALPASASLHRFDQRADVTQLGALVLAIALRRPLGSDEYPRGIGDLVIAATPDEAAPHASALRHWLQQALQLHPRTAFGSALDAQRMFAETAGACGLRRAGIQALHSLVLRRRSNPRGVFSDLRAS